MIFLLMVYLSAMPAAVEVSSEDYIVGGDNLTLTCRVGYSAEHRDNPYIYWRLNDVYSIYSASEFTEVDELTYPGMPLVMVSQINVTVPVYAPYLPKYSCSVQTEAHFEYFPQYSFTNYSYISLNLVYRRTTPITKVSCKYKPMYL